MRFVRRQPHFLFTVFIMLWTTGFLSGCSFDASITHEELQSPSIDLEPLPLARGAPDFVSGEVVTTTLGDPGFEVKGVFGEVSEKQRTANGWTVDGVFYE